MYKICQVWNEGFWFSEHQITTFDHSQRQKAALPIYFQSCQKHRDFVWGICLFNFIDIRLFFSPDILLPNHCGHKNNKKWRRELSTNCNMSPVLLSRMVEHWTAQQETLISLQVLLPLSKSDCIFFLICYKVDVSIFILNYKYISDYYCKYLINI